MIEIERSGWENLLNIVNYLCAGKQVRLSLVDHGQETTLAQADYFHGIEPYLQSTFNPLLAVVLAKENQVSLGYFLKQPSKITIEEEDSREIKKIFIDAGENKRAVIDFLQVGQTSKPKEVVYHHTISRKKSTP